MSEQEVSSLGKRKAPQEQLPFFIISPFSGKYRIWRDVLALLVLFNTVTSIFLLGLIVKKPEVPGGKEPKDSYGLFDYFDFGVDILFIIDAVMHLLCVSFINKKTSQLEHSHWSIFKRYICWFVIDGLSTIPAQLLLKFFHAPLKGPYGLFYLIDTYDLYIILRALQISGVFHYALRIILIFAQIWRLKRVHEMFVRMETNTKISYYVTRCLRFTLVTLIVVHCSGCIFCYIASTYGDVSKTWIGAALGPDIEQSSIWYRYFVSIYWSLTTLSTVGYGDIHAINLSEMIIVTLFMLFNMGLASYLIGGLTNLFAEASPTKQYRDIMVATSAFVKRNNLPPELRTQIEQHLTLKFKISTEAVEQQVIFGLVPKGIGCRVLHHLFSTRIGQVYLFKGVSKEFIFQLVSEVKAEYFPQFSDVVLENQLATDFYIIVDGIVELIKAPGASHNENKIVGREDVDAIFGEIGVVCGRAQPFTAHTRTLCQLLRIERSTFMQIVKENPGDGDIVMTNLLEHIAAEKGNREAVGFLLHFGANPIGQDSRGFTPLHAAVNAGQVETAKRLWSNGGAKDAIIILDNDNNTPLNLIPEGDEDMFEFLREEVAV